MALKTIRLELARTQEFPHGSPDRGYEFVAPLTPEGAFDVEEWRARRKECTVRRFWAGEDDEHGYLVHKGNRWAFHYAGHDSDEDEPIFRFDRHSFVEGEYISITEHDGVQRTFKVVSVR